MTLFIEVDTDGTISLIYPDDSFYQSKSIDEILEKIKEYVGDNPAKAVERETLGKLFDI